MTGSATRNRSIFTGIVGAMLGVVVGIGIAFLAASAGEREAAATGPGRGAGLVDPSLFEAP
jgi:ABC-type antimicrobial peptide transport system permease subunit